MTHRQSRLLGGQGGRIGALAAVLCLSLCGSTWAQGFGRTTTGIAAPTRPTMLQLPLTGTPTTAPPSGLSMSIDMTWVEGPGYHPVRVTISPTTPVRFDRTLEIRLRLPRQWNDRFGIIVTRNILIPAGTPVGAAIHRTISVPQMHEWDQLVVETLEEGFAIEELSTHWGIPGPGTGRQFFTSPRSTAALLVLLDGDANTLPAQITALSNSKFASLRSVNSQQSDSILWAAPQLPAGTQPLPGVSFDELPTRWIDYSAIDVMLASVDELKNLTTNHPAQFTAVRDWLRAGGNLMVYDVGDGWAKLASLTQLLDVPADKPSEETPGPNWRRPRPTDYLETLSLTPPPIAQEIDDALKGIQELHADDKNPFFVWRPVDSGAVVAIASSQPFTMSEAHWRTIYNTLGPQRWSWEQRNGVAFEADNVDFFDFLIPGVGMPPVATFCVLISAFTLVIGPINYFLLRRHSRLQFLILTVPIGALVVSGSLIAYAFVADGLAIRVRARSFTEIDQRTDTAVCWTRLSYYAGVSPAGGLVFDGDTVVYPLLAEGDPWTNRSDTHPRRELEWDEQQHLVSGWLTARDPTQFVTLRARKALAGLGIAQAEGAAAPRIENRLGTRIQHLVLMDAGGRTFSAADVAADQAVELTPATSDSNPLQVISEAYHRNLPTPPDMYSSSEALQGRRHVPDRYSSSQCRLEAQLFEAQQAITPRSYVAMVDRSPEVQLGTPSASEEASFHVIVGHW